MHILERQNQLIGGPFYFFGSRLPVYGIYYSWYTDSWVDSEAY